MLYSINLNLKTYMNMKTTKYILTIVLALVCIWSNSFAVDQSYYSSIDGKSGKNLFDAVHSVAKTGYKSLSYNGLWTAYCAIDLNSSGKVWDMYSNATSYNCGGPEEGANYTKEGDAYNREHSIPKNWFGGSDASNTPGTDLFHVVPTDGYVNNIRSAYAFGEVASASYTSKSGCKKGTPKSITVSNSLLNKSGSSTQSCSASTVFEPIDEYKGDFARGYFGTMIKWANGDYQTFTTAEGAQIFNTFYDAAHYYGLKAYGVALLLKWHREDPVSQKEIDRNNGIQNKQGNRNPFIDYPELVEYIWGEHCNEAVTLSSLTPTFEGYTPPAATTYTVILSRNGVTEAVSCLTGTYNLPASSSNACEGWTFAGWSATKVTSTTSTPSFVTSVTNGGTYYAVYSKTTASSAPRKAATVGTTLWAEDFSGYSNGDVPSGTISNSHTGTTIYNSGSVSYSVTNGSGTTKVYNENLATGTAPELLIAKSGGSFSISGIPTGNATAMTLTFKTNQTSNISVSSGTTGITVGSVSISSNTATCEITNDDAAAFNLTITKNNGGNSREDNFLLVVKTAGSGGGGSGTTYDSEPTDCNCSGKLGTPNVTATPGDGKITLTWDDVTDATNGYSVTISKGVGYTTECGDLSIGEITHSGTTNTCVISGLVNGLEYTTFVIANETATTCDSDPDEDTKTPIGCSDWDVAFSYSTYTIATGDAALAPEIVGTTYGAVHFESSNPSVLSVDEDGKVTAQAAGTATISAHWDGNETYCPKDMVSSLFTVTGTLVVTYDMNDGTLTPETKTQEVDYNEPVTLDANTFTRTGYTFQGWATTRDGSKVYNNQQSDVIFTETTTLYAVWGKKDYNVSFTPSPEGATVMVNSSSTSPQSAEYESTVTIAITPNVAYEIGSVTVTGDVSSNSISVSGEGNTRTFNMPAENVTVTVTMTAKTTYAIRFFNNGVQVGSTQNLIAGAVAVKPSDPTPCTSDYTFVGWWTAALAEDNTTTYSWVTDFTVTGAQDYYAVYSKTEGSGSSKTYNLVLTGNNFAGSYTERSSSATANEDGGSGTIDVNFTSNGVMKSSNSGNPIQFRKSGSGAGVLYNTTDLGTINSINYGDGSTNNIASTYKGATAQPTSDGTGGYFKITNGASVSYITSITINFTKTTGSSTTYYTTTPECPTPCTNEITITKGENPENGTFVLSNSGTVCIDEGNASTTVTATPNEHYHLATVTSTSGSVGTISGNECTITGINASTTINVTFAADPKDVVNWYVAGTPTEEEKYAGETLTGITAPTSSDCDGVKVFMGWTEEPIYFNETTAPGDLFTDPTTKTMPAGGTNYYAVFADATTSSGSNGTLEIDFEDVYGTYTDWSFTNMTSKQTNSNVTAKEGSYFGATGGTQTGSIRTVSKIAQPTSISFSVSKQTTNTTSSSWWVQTSSDGTNWEDVGNAQSATSMTRGVWVDVERDLSAKSDVYVRVYYEGSTAVRCIDGLVLTYGGSSTTTYSNYSTSCVTYEVTAISNNDAWGTVSVDGYKVTATPAEGYIADGYTITVGTATAMQNGNIYSVVPTSDCTIQINFREAAPYTVTFYDNNTSYNQTAYERTPFILPEDGLSSCPDATFLGWVEGTYADHATGTTTEPTYISPGAEVTLTEATTYTAVYGTIVNNVSTEYRLLTSFAEFKDGDYLVVAHYSENSHYAMSNTTTNDHMDEVSVSVDNGTTITSTQEKLIWTITKVGSHYTLYNANANKYLALSASAPLIQNEPHNFSMAFSSGFVFESVTETGSQLAYGSYFISQTSQSKPIYLYKRIPTIGSYTSHPECCYEPTEKLVIASDVETLIGSGVAHLTLSGGNGKNVTWSTTGGTLSDETNTSATLTLPAAGSYVVTAVQADDETNPEHVICGAEVSLTITVKSQWTITYKTIEESVEYTYNTAVVTDGESYTLPDISEEFTCPENISFAGWASSSSATAVEATAGTAQTASADATWYAVWRSGSGIKKESRTKYELISDVSSLNVNDVIVLAYNSVGMSTLDGTYFGTVEGLLAEDGSYITFAPEAVVQELTLKEGPEDTWYLYLEGEYMAFGNKTVSLQASAPSTGLSISISDNAATISDGTYKLQYNNNNPRFTAYSSSQKIPSIYRKNGTVEVEVSADVDYTTYNTCLSGAVIRANTEQWITASKGQKVKRVYEVKALNFDEPSTLTIQSNTDSHFTATLAETAIPAAPGRLETTLTVEYLPTEDNTANSTTITLRAGETTKTLEVNGRSLPEEFLIITKKTVWYALPANMNGGEKQYEGFGVTPDDGAEPSSVAVAPSTIVYSLRSVADSRYADNGTCVRLAGNGNKALWGNIIADATTIQNNEIIGSTNGANYEWLLNTTDGIHYSIGNPNHADFEAGRVLAFGDKFGQYKSPTVFYLVPTGCNSQPQDVSVSARRVDATFSWLSNASSMAIDVYTDEEMTVLATSVTATSVPYYMTGLNETTNYWFRLTPDGEDACSVTGTFKTTGPTVDIVEWETDGVVIFVDKDEALNPYVVIEGEVEHGMGTAYNATELFFSKYFEGSGDMKLVAIFNGTPDDISLDDYRLYTKNCSAPKNEGAIASSEFSSTTEYPISALGIIKSGQEIVFFTRPTASTQASLSECSEAFLDEMAAKSGADEMPRWIECNNSTLYNGQKFPLMQFNGNDAICLAKNDALIDVIGSTGDPGKVKNCANRLNDLGWSISVKNIDYGKTSDDPAFDNLYETSSHDPITDAERRAILGGFNINLDDETINLTTARCILFRDKSVTSGERAVALNTDADFATCAPFTYEAVDYPSEWNGRAVCMTTAMQTAAGVTDDSRATCNSYQDLGEFDYNDYYKEWTSIDGKTLDEYTYHEDTKTYDIPIDNLSKYTCLNIRFQLKNDAGEVVTESPVQVPIIVKDGHTTIDAIFNAIVKTDGGDPLYDESIERCKTCDVVVLSDGVLTKAADSETHDVPEVGNVKVYPGGQLIVPTGTSYSVNSLAFRRQEDEVATANIQGDLDIKAAGNNVYLDLRVDPSEWHYIALPYNCNVADIRFAGDEMKIPILGTDYLLKYYDGEKRAATQAGGCWEMVAPDATLRKGIGYIFGIPGEGKVKREFRFPMSNEIITEEKDPEGKIASGVYAFGGDKSMTEVRANHRGWNLIGDPYLLPYSSDIADPVITGYIVPDYPEDPEAQWDGHYKFADDARSDLRYIVEPVDNGRSEYIQVPITAYEMKPFTSYFVQIGGSNPEAEQGVQFHLSAVDRSASPVRRAPAEYAEEQEDKHPVWCAVTITSPKGEKDETTMLISDQFTDGYDMMDDLVKMRGTYYQYAQITTKPVLASRNNEGEMAFNALPDASAEAGIPLHYFAATQGEYVLAYSDKYGSEEIQAVMLLDKQLNEWHDLMNEPYTFYTNRTDDKNRFVLTIRVDRRKEPQIATDTDAASSANDRPRKILHNDHIYILRGDRIYDITGKEMLNR